MFHIVVFMIDISPDNIHHIFNNRHTEEVPTRLHGLLYVPLVVGRVVELHAPKIGLVVASPAYRVDPVDVLC